MTHHDTTFEADDFFKSNVNLIVVTNDRFTSIKIDIVF